MCCYGEREVIDISKMPEVIDKVNKALNDNRIVEIKNEGYTTPNVVVVCIDRKVLIKSRKDKVFQFNENK